MEALSLSSSVERLLKSKGCMDMITSYMPMKTLISYNLLNRYFYDRLVPEIMEQRKLYQSLDKDTHLFIEKNKLYGLGINLKHDIKEVDFEEDNWRHDSQYTIDDKPKMLLDFAKLGEGEEDEELKVASDEQILPHFILPLGKNKFLVYPLKEAIFLNRGLIIDCQPGEKIIIKKTSPPPEKLLRPGVCPQQKGGRMLTILFLGGNESKQNYLYNL